MRTGVVFPQTEIGADRGAVRAYAQRVEELGFDHLLAYDHVLGADPSAHPDWSGPYTHRDTFHEPFVLFGFLAGICSLELVTGVIVLPQRQTALVAKQAAEVDLLTGGRLRLGIGIGWNAVEYEALGEDFRTRGRRIEEQIEVLRALWTEPVVNIRGEAHQVTGAGIAPLPLQRPIPIWLGAQSAPARSDGQVGWATAGCHSSSPVPSSTTRSRSCTRARERRDAIPHPLAWKGASLSGATTPTRWAGTPNAGVGPERPTCRSTR